MSAHMSAHMSKHISTQTAIRMSVRMSMRMSAHISAHMRAHKSVDVATGPGMTDTGPMEAWDGGFGLGDCRGRTDPWPFGVNELGVWKVVVLSAIRYGGAWGMEGDGAVDIPDPSMHARRRACGRTAKV